VKNYKILYLWAVVVLAIAVVIGCGVWASTRNDAPVGSRTVSEAISGGVRQEQQSGSASSIQDDQVLSLAASLGIPLDSVPRGILKEQSSREQNREELRRTLNVAVENGLLTSFEAHGVMQAFDAGLVTSAVDSFVAESSPAR